MFKEEAEDEQTCSTQRIIRSCEHTIRRTCFNCKQPCSFKFACRIDSGADLDVISETIVNFLSEEGVFLPTMRPKSGVPLKAVDEHHVHSSGVEQFNPLLQTIAGPCRL